MGIVVLLSPIQFFRLKIIIYKFKTTIFSIQREIIIISIFRKLINGISISLEIRKNIMSA